MKRYIFTILLAVMLTGCNAYVRYYEDQPINIIGVELVDWKEGYKYRYLIEIFIEDDGGVESPKVYRAYMYSNKRYGMGDTIWMGARWGKKMSQDNKEKL